MKITRRATMIGAGLGAAAIAMPAFAKASRIPALAILDSRLPDAAAFRRDCDARAIPLLDLARDEHLLLDPASLEVRSGAVVIGLTGWSHFVLLRGMLHGKGLRVVSETRIDRGPRSLFEWTMA